MPAGTGPAGRPGELRAGTALRAGRERGRSPGPLWAEEGDGTARTAVSAGRRRPALTGCGAMQLVRQKDLMGAKVAGVGSRRGRTGRRVRAVLALLLVAGIGSGCAARSGDGRGATADRRSAAPGTPTASAKRGIARQPGQQQPGPRLGAAAESLAEYARRPGGTQTARAATARSGNSPRRRWSRRRHPRSSRGSPPGRGSR